MADGGKGNRFENMTEAEMVKLHSRSILALEAIWDEAARRLDGMAGDDRAGDLARKASKAKSMYYELKAFHCRADAFAAQFGNPATRTGER